MRREWWIGCVLALAVFAAYAGVRHNDFIDFDDPTYLTENPHVRAGPTPDGIAWAFSTFYASNWHPLTWLSHMVDWRLYGNSAAGHHMMNVALHAANSILIFLLLVRMTQGATWAAALVAFLFALHPLHVESVAWASERKDTLSTLFWLLTTVAYIGYARRPSAGRYLLVLLMLALGLMAKPMLVTLPLTLLLLDYWPLRRASSGDGPFAKATWGRLLLEKLPLLALVTAASAVTVLAQHFARATWTQLPLSARLSNAPVSYVTYIRKMILPTDLAIFYPHGYALAGGGPPPVFVAACALLLLAITSAVVLLRRTRPYLLTGWLWYLGTLVPVIGLVQVGDQAMADRYTYIPLIGLFIMLAWGTRDIAAAIARRWQGMGPLWATAAALVLLACAVLTWQQVGSWRDPKTLWQHAADVVPNNYFAHTNLGGFAMADGQTDEWLAHCQAAVRAAPGDSPAQSNLAYALAAQGHPAEALQHYSRALELAPTNTRAHQNLANLLLDLGRPKEAAAHCRTALALETDRALAAKVHNSLGLALVAQVQIDDALGEFSKAAELDPAYPQPLYYMGMAQEMRGRSAEAADSYERALRLAPRWADVLRRLALLRATDADAQVRQPDEAVALARKACSLLGRSPSPAAAAQYLDALAAAYAAAGRFPDAVAAADRAHQDAVAGNQNAFAEEIAQRLALYRAGRPFVAPPVKPSPTTRP